MAWIKTAASKKETQWIYFDASFKAMSRSILVFFRDGVISGLILGLLVGLTTNWPGAAFRAQYNGWSDRQKEVSNQIDSKPVRPLPPAMKPAPATVAPAHNVQTRTDGTDMESSNQYMPKWDMGFNAAQHTLTFRLVCMPAPTQCAETQEEPAYVTFEGPASTRLTATVPMHPTVDARNYSASLFVVGPDQFSAPNRVLIPVGQWHMTVTFPKFNKQSEKTFWVSCPKGQACSVVDYPIPIIER